jgi:methionine synthase I (cobalamin-dependent)/5,10-methylenetetrahydrofolate reductase
LEESVNMTRISDIGFPLLFDGAMGTYYPEVSKNPLPLCEMGNIFDRDAILKIHREYIEAGAKAIKTNTFQANRIYLSSEFDVVKKVIESGIKIAREAADNKNVLIFGNIGQMPPKEATGFDDYREIADVFLTNGISAFLFETYSSLDYLIEIAEYIKSKEKDSFIITSFAIEADGQTRMGEWGNNLINEAAACEHIDAVGFNCVSGPLRIREYLEKIDIPETKLSIMPNAGYPTVINGRTFYPNNKEYFANAAAKMMAELGVEIIGGCCGTTPEYIKEIAAIIPHYSRIKKVKRGAKSVRLETPYKENLFRNKLEHGKKPIAVEFDPPQDLNIAKYMENIKKLKLAGTDAVTIADCPVARARIDASMIAYKMKNELGMEAVVHMNCRDRNINATKAILLGLNVENILNIIVVTGDPIPTAERDEVKSVFQFNSIKLANFIDNLNKDLFTNPMNIGAALNVNARNFEAELNRAKKKEEAGVNVFYTQPVISDYAVENMKLARKELKAYIMGGIFPIVSYRNAVFMESEISGIHIAQTIIDLYKNKDKEECSKLAVDIAFDFTKKIEDYIDGFYIITPFSRVDLVTKLISKIKREIQVSKRRF